MKKPPTPAEILATAAVVLKSSGPTPEQVELLRSDSESLNLIVDGVPMVCRVRADNIVADIWSPFTDEAELVLLAAEAAWQSGQEPDFQGEVGGEKLLRVALMVETELHVFNQYQFMAAQQKNPAAVEEEISDDEFRAQILIRLVYRWAHYVKTHLRFREHVRELPGFVVTSAESEGFQAQLGGIWHQYLWSLEDRDGCLYFSVENGESECLWIAATTDPIAEDGMGALLEEVVRLVPRLKRAPFRYDFPATQDARRFATIYADSEEEAYQGLPLVTGLRPAHIVECFEREPLRKDTRDFPSEDAESVLMGKPVPRTISLPWMDDFLRL